MQEVESKRKLTPADGAHIFYTGIFLTASYLIKTRYPTECSANLELFNDLLFYGLLIWATFLVITLVPRYKNEGLRLFFNVLDLLYGLFHVSLVIYTASEYYETESDCAINAPQLNFLANLYIWVTGFASVIVLLGFIVWFFRRFIKPNDLAGFNRAEL